MPQCQISSSSGSMRRRYRSSSTASDMATLSCGKGFVGFPTGVTLDVRLHRVAIPTHIVTAVTNALAAADAVGAVDATAGRTAVMPSGRDGSRPGTGAQHLRRQFV